MDQTFKHILVLLQHDTDSSGVLSRAAALATLHQSRITVFKSYYKALDKAAANDAGSRDDLALFLHQQQQQICRQLNQITQQPIKLNIILSWRESEKQAVKHLIEQQDISLILSLQSTKRGIIPLLTPGLEHYLIAECELPVWLVKPGNTDTELNILACLDVDSEDLSNNQLNDAILDIGYALTQHQPQQLHVINCYCSDNYSMSLPYNDDNGFVPLPDIAAQHSDKLQPYLRQHQLPASRLHLADGLPDDEIPSTVRQLHSQLAIIGNNHLHQARTALLGDTAHYLAAHTPCDVLVVKPPSMAAITLPTEA